MALIVRPLYGQRPSRPLSIPTLPQVSLGFVILALPFWEAVRAFTGFGMTPGSLSSGPLSLKIFLRTL